MSDELIPPASLQPPEPAEVVTPDEAQRMVPLDEEVLAQLDDRVVAFVDDLTEADVHSEPFNARLDAVHALGTAEIREAANVSNRMLNRPVRGLSEDAPVTKALLELRRTVEELDPAQQDAVDRKILGLIPVGRGLTDYFRSYRSAQDHIDAVLNSLHHSQDELRKDVATIEQEKVNLWGIMGRLQQAIYLCRQMDTALQMRVAEFETEDPQKATVVKEEILFYVRQKTQDLLTQLAVSVQGYLALDVIRRNDLELIKGVERATTTTISALRTAVIVAQALSNQKLVLDQISALNTTTGNLIASTSQMLRTQSGELHGQASQATVDMEQLQSAFENVYATLDMIATYKLEALDVMAQTIDCLSQQVVRARTYLDRVRDEQALEAGSDLFELPGDES
jgi:uncharacterized protein YaaN involved in tellurite resistance